MHIELLNKGFFETLLLFVAFLGSLYSSKFRRRGESVAPCLSSGDSAAQVECGKGGVGLARM